MSNTQFFGPFGTEFARFDEFLLAIEERDIVIDSEVTNPHDYDDVVRNLRAARDATTD